MAYILEEFAEERTSLVSDYFDSLFTRPKGFKKVNNAGMQEQSPVTLEKHIRKWAL